MLLYCGNLKRLWFIELPDHQVSVIHITLNSNLSDINRLKRLSRFFWKLLIFRCSIEKLLLSKWFKFREDSLEVKYCKHLKLKAFQKQFHLDLDCHSIKIGDGVHVQSIFHSRLHPVFLLRSSLPSLTLFPVFVIPSLFH